MNNEKVLTLLIFPEQGRLLTTKFYECIFLTLYNYHAVKVFVFNF